MGNTCNSYCNYEEGPQLNLDNNYNTSQQANAYLIRQQIEAAKRKSKKSIMKSREKSPEDKNIYWLRGLGPSQRSSPYRLPHLRSPSSQSPLREVGPVPEINVIKVMPDDSLLQINSPQSINLSKLNHTQLQNQSIIQLQHPIITESPDEAYMSLPPEETSNLQISHSSSPVVVEQPKKRRQRKIKDGRFPFNFELHPENQQQYGEQTLYSQRLNVIDNRLISPNKKIMNYNLEKLAQNLNNKLHNQLLRQPQLADELIITQKPEQLGAAKPKRLNFKDASVQNELSMFSSTNGATKECQTDIDTLQQQNILSVTKDTQTKKDRSTDASTLTDVSPMLVKPVPEPQQLRQIIIEQTSETKKTPPTRNMALNRPVIPSYYEIIIDPDEEILREGEMLKFKPGIEKNFISRWVQLSNRSFRYYKNHYHSICYLTRPISALPLAAIEDVRKFEIQNQDYKRKDKDLYLFMFEITLKQDYEDIFFFREFEINGVTNNSPGLAQLSMISPMKGSDPNTSLQRRSRSNSQNREVMVVNNLSNSKIIQDNSRLSYGVSPQRKLIISPPKRDKSRDERSSSSNAKNTLNDKVTRIVQGHLMPIRDSNLGVQREHYLEDQKIVQKQFGEPSVNIHGHQKTFTWTNRQNEWYNSERRFIFTCKTEKERMKWITTIKKAVKDNLERIKIEQDNENDPLRLSHLRHPIINNESVDNGHQLLSNSDRKIFQGSGMSSSDQILKYLSIEELNLRYKPNSFIVSPQRSSEKKERPVSGIIREERDNLNLSYS